MPPHDSAPRDVAEDATAGRTVWRDEAFRICVETLLDCFGVFTAVRGADGRIADFRVDFLNEAACRNNGLALDVQVGRGILELWPAHIQTGLFDAYVHVVESGEPLHRVMQMFPRDGDRWYDIRATRLGDGFVAAWRDISERVRDLSRQRAAEAALRASDERLRLALNGAGAAVWEWDVRDRAIHWSPENFALWGRDPAAGPPSRADWASSIHPEDRERAAQAMDDVLGGRAEEYRVECRAVRPDGAERWLLGVGKLLRDERGTPLRVVGLNMDITERRGREEQSRRIQETFYRIIKNAPFGVYLVDADFCLREISVGAQKVFSGVEQPIGRDFAEVLRMLWTEPFASEAIGRFRHTLATGEPYRSPATVERRNDLDVVEAYDWRISRITLPDGRHGVVCYFYDLSDRQRWEAALRESEARLRLAMRVSATGIWDWDLVADTVSWSPECYPIMGFAPGAFDGRHATFAALVHPDDRASVQASVALALDRQAPYQSEFRIIRPDGSLRWVANSGQAFYGENGTPVRVLGTVTDITERKCVEAELEQSAERLHLAKEAGGLGIHDYDITTGHIDWDARVRELWGVGAGDEITYRTFVDGVHPADRDATERALRQALDASGSGRYYAEYRVVNARDGVTRWIAATGQTTFADGRAVRLVGTVQDVSAIKQAEAALREADRRKDEFLATLAHELRNPLAPIRQAAAIARTPGATAAQVSWSHDVITRQADRMALLLDDLMDVARITQGKVELNRVAIAVRDVVHAAVETVGALMESRRHALVVDLPDAPLNVHADPLRLSQVLSNLLTNAAKYTPPGGNVRLSAARDGDTVRLVVRDTGVGIEPQDIEGVFGMFSQGPAHAAATDGGLGIGLALARALVELHGGTLTARSEGRGRGAEFIVTLAALDVVPASPAPTSSAAALTTPVRVLVVDDNVDAAESLAMLLRVEGHVVRTAHNGVAGLDAAVRTLPDIALIDLSMPGMDGFELARRIRRMPGGGGIRLVAVTGWVPEDRRDASATDFDLVLTKPVALESLYGVVADAANGRVEK